MKNLFVYFALFLGLAFLVYPPSKVRANTGDNTKRPMQINCTDESGWVTLAFGACCVAGGEGCVANDCPVGTYPPGDLSYPCKR